MSQTTPTKIPPVCHFWEIWRNPIFLRYCRARLRPTGLGASCLITILVSGFLFQMIRTFSDNRTELDVMDIERAPLVTLLIIQAFILFVLGTAQASGGMTAERDEGVIDYQRLLPMSSVSKVIGYLFGLPIRETVMFLCTLPFTLWCFIRGQVPLGVMLSIYGVMASTTLLYHLTGLLTGTIVKNRRWAFLMTIGLIFSLYTIIPQAAKFGLVFFKYLTITPTIQDAMPDLVPKTFGAAIDVSRRLFSEARFFNLDFPEAVFTWFTQACLIITFFVMLCRRWRDADAHLSGKLWASGFFLWIQILLLGNSIPLIDSGKLFPTQQFARFSVFTRGQQWEPDRWEAMAMILAYGFLTLILLWVMSSLITPSYETVVNGWRRAHKLQKNRLPLLADESNSTPYVLVMSLIGGAGWFYFTHMIVESRWFPGHFSPISNSGWFLLAIVTCGLLHHLILELKGTRTLFMCIIFIVVVPLMLSAILFGTSDRLQPLAVWVGGISPLGLPFLTAANHLSITELPLLIDRTVPSVWTFWQGVYIIVIMRLTYSLYQKRSRLKATLLSQSSAPTST
jgi:hypothetical protein